ncbi:AMP-dependent synthetase [Ureibacillus manganicus DSM 26584]|uniref:AMP-dependent synthetase n=1 Tax=Ureibacillus manganicus DSM 26584 TaxID=1384049 RepID=A0A0A3HQZ8_9BACL|nr:AMP-dependent synthetase [Ureibacillus manganicus DSM 26584]
MFRLLYVLYKIKCISPISLYYLVTSFSTCGVNLMTLLNFAARKYSNQSFLVSEEETLSYKQLLDSSSKLAIALKEKLGIQSGNKVAIMCKNHASLVKSIFAVSRLGADVYFINTEISKSKFNELIQQHHFHLLIYDSELGSIVDQSNNLNPKVLSYHSELPAINNHLLFKGDENYKLPRASGGKIVLHTSGTTGSSKEIVHSPSLFNYLNPFIALITRLKILKYNKAYIATPIYHGYGIAILLLFIPLGKQIIIRRNFNAQSASYLIKEHRIEVITVVPTMLQRLLDTNAKDLKSLRCIASGGAKLPKKLIDDTLHSLGKVLYNLYGSTEAGLNFIATPYDLMHSSTTIGRKINGMDLRVLDRHMNEVKLGGVGQLCIKNEWSMSNKETSWIQTGDLGYQDEHGLFYLSGRIDDMIISGGVNVYPIEVEHILMSHPEIIDAAVIGIEDEVFGQRLKAFIQPKSVSLITNQEIELWLRTRLSKFQLPKEIEVVKELPYTSLGKLDRKQLYKVNSKNEFS